MSLPKGLVGYYYYPSVENGVLQKSTEFINTKIDGTRIDEEINFESVGYGLHSKPFQFWFLNDYRKFNDPAIEKWLIPLSVIWKGYVYAPNLDNLKINASTNGEIKLYLNKKEIVDRANFYISEQYRNKFIPIEIIYNRSRQTTQFLKLSIPNTYFFPQKYSDFQAYWDKLAQIIDNVIKIIVLLTISSILFLLVRQINYKELFLSSRFHLFFTFLILLYLSVRQLLQKASSEYFNYLALGNDPLTYETFARHIQLTGNWSMSALETGAYYYQVLYYHTLVIAHYLMGESLFPIIFIQVISVLITALLVVWICKLFIKKNSLVFIPILFLSALNPVTLKQAFQMFPVGTFLIILVSFLLLLAETEIIINKKLALTYFFLAGISLGLSILMRNNAAILLVFILLWFIFSFKKSFLIPFVSFLVGTILPLMPFLVRNRLLSGQFVLMSKSALTNNFILANSPPSHYIYSEKNYDAMMNFANNFVDGRAFPVIQWILDQPLDYLKLASQKFLYFLGFTSSEATLWLSIPFILFLICSILFLVKPALFSKFSKRKDYLITGGFAWTHLATIAFFAVSQQRYSVPLMPFLILFSCLLIIPLSKIFLRFLPLKFQSNYLEI